MNRTQYEQLISSRESTFANQLEQGYQIDDDDIIALLDNAVWAPTHGLSQCWEFIVFAGDGVRQFYEKQQHIYKEITHTDKFRQEKYDGYLGKIRKVSHVIAVIARRDPKKRFPVLEDIVSTACALENIYLGLKPFGISGYLSTGDICYSGQMREYLKLNEEDECLGFFILGKAKVDMPAKLRKRIPAKEKTTWVR